MADIGLRGPDWERGFREGFSASYVAHVARRLAEKLRENHEDERRRYEAELIELEDAIRKGGDSKGRTDILEAHGLDGDTRCVRCSGRINPPVCCCAEGPELPTVGSLLKLIAERPALADRDATARKEESGTAKEGGER